ncbi:MAG: SDR family NAD(P)-dependent oxidoreductase [Polyangiaceae bacterium]|nr:SDR family NAD(P)-dependent oxidoreductase [Polyangiaceae bacterium]
MSQGTDLETYLRRVTAALVETKQDLEDLRARAHEPIAIVGWSVRLPGGVENAEDLWQLVLHGVDAITPFPDRPTWETNGLYDPDPEVAGRSYTRHGGFLDNPGHFDASLFRMSPREAKWTDPQHRLLLEATWEAIEHAGIVPASLEESATGVYVGISYTDYGTLSEDLDDRTANRATLSLASGRISYTLGLQGPAVSIDTACSSSLVAMHLAMQALRRGECDLALAGGVCVMATPSVIVDLCRQRALSPDGRCRSFSDDADGTGMSEGCGMLLLERLSDAQRNGRRILAVLRGSAVNQDGRSQGFTAPNGPSQERVILQALASAGLSASDVDAVEAHGTGTTLGDPIEAGALLATYGQAHTAESPLYIGALKSNLGHPQAAAGVAGVIKMVKALEHETLPPSLYADKPTRHVDWTQGHVRLLKEAVSWPRNGRVRRAGVSSFGISGTNAHVIVEEAPAPAMEERGPRETSWEVPLVVSGVSEASLRANSARLAEWLERGPELVDVAYSAATTRTAFRERASFSAGDAATAIEGLRAVADGRVPKGGVRATARSRRTVLVFPGQGSQYPGMCRGLLAEPAFAEALAECDEAIRAHTGMSVAALLNGTDEEQKEAFENVEIVQPVLFAVAIALARLWGSFGVEPDAVMGHSQGEVAAAVVAGALSVEEGARIVCVRSALLKGLSGAGAMASVALPVEAVEALLARHEGLSVAVVNTAESTVVAGDEGRVEALLSELGALGVFCRRIAVGYASHSSQVDPILAGIREGLSTLEPREAKAKLYSTVRGELLSGRELDGNYWADNLRMPVRMDRALAALGEPETALLLEVSAHPLLVGPLGLAGHEAVVGTLHRDEPAASAIRRAAGHVHAHGGRLDWEAVHAGSGARPAPLPTYAFQREHYWIEPVARVGPAASSLGLEKGGHAVLRTWTELPDGGALFAGRLDLSSHAWLADHKVFDTVVVPGVAVLDLALHAAMQLGLDAVREVVHASPLVLEAGRERSVRLAVSPRAADGTRAFTLSTRPADGEAARAWIEHATGLLGSDACSDRPPVLVAWPPPGAREVALSDLYERLARLGVTYGPSFRGLERAWQTDEAGVTYVEASILDALGREAEEGFGLHPALFDSVLHGLAATATGSSSAGAHMPFEWRDARLFAVGASAVRARLARRGDQDTRIDIYDAMGEPVARVGAMRTLAAPPALMAQARAEQGRLGHLYRVSTVAVGWVAETEARPTRELGATVEQLAEAADGATALVRWPPSAGGDETIDGVHAIVQRGVAWLQAWLSMESTALLRVVWVTRHALALSAESAPPSAAMAALWGLGRSFQLEHPDRELVLLDADIDIGEELLARLPGGEPQLAVRDGSLLALRLVEATEPPLSPPRGADAWRLDVRERGRLDALGYASTTDGSRSLEPHDVRLEVRAAGLIFRDVLGALGMYPGEAGRLGNEAAAVVLEVGRDVEHVRPGDRVFGLVPGAFAPVVVADARLLRRMPASLSFVEAATLPVSFLTAMFGLQDLGELAPGQRLLVHAAAGGVGMAAVQLARLVGAEVFATASRPKWALLRSLGIPEDHIASSRDTSFKESFLSVTGGRGVDVVLDSLADDKVDASLALLSRGGCFLEMGKTDVRDAARVAEQHPGVRYRAFDLMEAGAERLGAMLQEVAELVEAGRIRPLPHHGFDFAEAEDAFRFLAKGRSTGKLVLLPPRRLDPNGTVLITGATGGLGRVTAKHLVEEHGVRHLLLLSRSGSAAAGAGEWVRELEAAGAATVTVRACDASSRDALAAALASIPPEHPLTGVFHLAMALDDAMLGDITPERVDGVLRAKVDAAFHLDELTRTCDLGAFVLFSSVVGVFGGAAQSTYAAANAALDALAIRRRRRGLAGKSLAWGSWAEVGRAARLHHAFKQRTRSAGVIPLEVASGMQLLDAALEHPEPVLVPIHFDRGALRRAASRDTGLALLRSLSGARPRRAGTPGTGSESAFAARLAPLSDPERHDLVLATIRSEVAQVLGLGRPEAVPVDQPLRDLGLDSLMAVETRNRLASLLGTKLPASLLFDHPTPKDLARFIEARLGGRAPAASVPAIHRETEEPIAIIAMGARYPGEVRSADDLWSLVARGGDGISGFPARPGWDADALYDPDPSAIGRSYVRQGGFLHDADLFDPGFFHISPREAARLDPQHRVLLEAAWETIEGAGIVPSTLQGSLTGVYVGVMYAGYGAAGGVEVLDGHAVTGLTQSTASGRIAYTLGLQGPALSIDTACSSSLVAVHLAMQGLRRGECDLALAGGVTVMGTPAGFIEFSRQRGLASDGRCKPFSDDADGMSMGEGCGLILLERLSDAQKNGRRILAILRGSAINQDGKSQGFTAPHGPSQERVILQALASAGISASDVDAVEAHGTGTTLGDPIEAGALLATYGQAHTAESPVYVGSVKANIGHAQAAAGVAGVIKMVEALEHETLPPSLHADRPTRHVDWTQGHVRLLSEAVPWPRGGRVRRAGVSSFGISGTNAHVILEEGPERARRDPAVTAASWPAPLVVSGPTDDALRANSARLADWLERDVERSRATLLDIAYSLATTRTAFRERASLFAGDVTAAIEGLRALADGGAPSGGGRATARCHRTVFVFPGQGSQYAGMCRGLLANPAFAEALAECDAAIRRHAGFSVTELLHGTEAEQEEAYEKVDLVQPILFAVAVALARVWASYGVTPDAVVGHSQGEIAAAVVAGALSVEDGARIVCLRSRLIAGLGGAGAMASIALPVTAVEALLARHEGLSIAVVNTPESTVVAGDRPRIEALLSELGARGVFCRQIAVGYASHSSHVDPILDAIRDGLVALTPRHARTKLYSTVRGEALDGADLDARYWADNLRMPVRMDLALAALGERETTLLVEVSAHPVLVGPLGLAGYEAVVGTLHREEDGASAIRRSAGQVHAHGIRVDWEALYARSGARRVELPTYAFQRERYWLPAPEPEAGDVPAMGRIEHLYQVTPCAVGWAPADEALVIDDIGPTLDELGRAADAGALLVRWPSAASGDETVERVHDVVRRGVAWLQRWLSMEDAANLRVVWVTRGALALSGDSVAPSVAAAALWGLGRSFQLEHPDHDLVLVDTDAEVGGDLLARLPDGEPQLVVRDGGLRALRLQGAREASSPAWGLDREGTVVITGATGGLGRVTARHLVERHGVRHLLLLSRSGGSSAGAAAWAEQLKAAGAATATVRACDVSDHDALASALREIPPEHPLVGVFHLAAAFDDALLQDITPERVDAVLRAKVDAAFHLDELTRDLDVGAFVLFSSVTGTLGSPAQATYAAANAALDALAERRRRLGLPGKSLAWGGWAEVGRAAELKGTLRHRIQRSGLVSFAPDAALDLLDVALAHPDAVLVPIQLDRAALDRAASQGAAHPLLRPAPRGRGPRSRAPATARRSAFAARLGRLAAKERRELLLATVRAEIARVLGIRGPEAVPIDQPLRDLGLDSLMAVEARNRLSAIVGTKLRASLLFDYPTPAELADFLDAQLRGVVPAPVAAPQHAGTDEPIAIIAMGARYPADVRSAEDLWSLISARRDAISEFPARPGWDANALYDADPSAPGRSYVREGGFLHDAALFDPGFFRISPREATALDPQQRVLLEVAWETIERAGIVPAALERSLTGVYVGIMYEGYGATGGAEALEGYAVTGLTQSTASGRIAYALGLQGPALSIDTACSSSLVAVHLAMQALRRGECDLALAGGVTVMGTPAGFIEFSRQRGLASDGRCKPFSDDADGMSMSEGCGLLLLERLSDAQRNGRRILALLRGSAVNQDGKSQGFTAPNGPSQERVISQALASAGISASDVDAVEAHGTGTTIGDPIEAGALLATYGQAHTADAPLYIGAAKSNIGHTAAAAGVAGIIKMVKALEHETLPPSLHADKPTRHVDWTQGHARLLPEAVPWRRGGRVRRAGVSSFGISGTNAHVILEEAPEGAQRDTAEVVAPWSVPLVVSGATEDALRANSARLADWLERGGQGSRATLLHVGYSLATTRTPFRERASFPAADVATAIAGLRSLADGKVPAAGVRAPATRRRTVFVFPGQGGQHAGMCRGLLTERAFAEALAECDEAVRRHADLSVLGVLSAPDDEQAAQLERVEVVQPVLFAVAIALARLWASYGVTPDAVMGHSQGEIAAAVVAGALSLDEGAQIVCLRGRLLEGLDGHGAMASVALPADAVEALLARHEELSIAVVNTAESTVVAGDGARVEALLAELGAQGVFCRRIAVGYASHSPQVEPLLGAIRAGLEALRPRRGRTKLYSTVRGEALDGAELDGRYWADNLRMPVRMDRALAALGERDTTLLVEVSAHPVLVGPLGLAGYEAVVGTLHRGEHAADAIRRSAGQVHAHGIRVDWEALYAGSGARRVELPTYAFQRQHYWLDANARRPIDLRDLGVEAGDHPFLSTMTELDDGAVVFTGSVDLSRHGWLRDHRVFDTTLAPGTAVVDLALHAAWKLGLDGVEEVVLERPLVIEEGRARHIRLMVSAGAKGEGGARRPFSLHTRESDDPGATWIQHASGALGLDRGDEPAPAAWPPPGAATEVDATALYEDAARIGLSYGPTFRALKRFWRDGHDIYAEAELPLALASEATSFGFHPALFDSVLHATLFAFTEGAPLTSARLPFEWRDVRLSAAGATAVRARIRRSGEEEVRVDFFDLTGAPVASVGGLVGRAADRRLLEASAPATVPDLYRVLAQPMVAPPRVEAPAWIELDAAAPAFDGVSEAQAASSIVVVRWHREDGLDGASETGSPRSVHEVVHRGLAWLKAWLAEARLAETRVVWLTAGALQIADGDGPPSPALAALWGLARSFQVEHPERTLVLVDADAKAFTTLDAVAGRLPEGERQLAIRGGAPHALRLAPAEADGRAAPRFDTAGTVLITGATGGLGRAVARHLVENHGVKHLMLLSRSGAGAPGSIEWAQDLERAGAVAVALRSCDVADRAALASVLAEIPPEHPLTAVFHLAMVLDDGLVADLTPARVDTVLRPKVDAAYHLDALTRGARLDAFVVYSGAAGIFGNAGQAHYAAANTAVDALVARRRSEGLPGLSLAWGSWDEVGFAARMKEVFRSRMQRSGLPALDPSSALGLLDAALGRPEPLLVPIRIDRVALRRIAAERGDAIPPLLHDIVRPQRRKAKTRATGTSALAARLRGLGAAEREAGALDVVRGVLAVVLGLATPESVPPDRPLQELGLDSLMALEARNQLASLVGQKLPATLLFDHPTPAEIARFLCTRLEGDPARRSPAAATRGDTEEPIAIIGMSARFPGDVHSAEDLWRLVRERRDAITPFPARPGWDVDALYDPDPDAVGRTYVREGGFLSDAALFDASFFRIGAREAAHTDPQHRVLLEGCWEAIEDAGIIPPLLSGSATGVYMGVMYSDYLAPFVGSEAVDAMGGPGMGQSIASGRVSYTFGLQGPSLTVDTACSSSLVAVHLAMQGLRHGECSLALAGGVTIMGTPGPFIAFSRQRGLAPDGRCKPFSDDADGATWSEGCGVLLLERLSDAQRNGHRILGVLRGSAVNQDGRSQGFTAPNGPSQERVIMSALASARLSASDVDAVEAHGTGTTLGDPIEAGALLATYGEAHTEASPLYLGTLKSNLGHTQAAAGIAGIIKMVKALEHETLPASRYADKPTRHVDWSRGHVRLLANEVPWPRRDRPRRAGVSSFGVSGTNAHVILEEAPAVPAADAPRRSPAVVPLVLSGQTGEALRANARRLARRLSEQPALSLTDVAYSLAVTRSAFAHRGALVVDPAATLEEVASQLERIAERGSAPGWIRGPEEPRRSRLAVLFTGQGSQRAGMGRAAYEADARFRAHLDEVAGALDRHLDRPLLEVLFAEEGTAEGDRLHETEHAQPALFAIEVALFRRLRDLGVAPSVLVGHSVGEIAAAHVSGVLSLDDAARLVAARGRAMQRCPRGGAMASIAASEAEVQRELTEGVVIAAVNGPEQTVVSGDAPRVDDIVRRFERAGRQVTRLHVSHAFHSSHVDAAAAAVEEVARGCSFGAPRIPIVSTVTGKRASSDELGSAEHWARQVKEPVRFHGAITTIGAEGPTTFVECGPHGVLIAMAAACLPDDGGHIYLPTLRKDESDIAAMLRTVIRAHVAGHEVDWEAVYEGTGARRVDLPTYAFQREYLWISASPRRRVDPAELGLEPADHPSLATTTGPSRAEGALVAELARAPAPLRHGLVLDAIRSELAEVLALPTPDAIAPDRPLDELGLDSLMSVEVKNRLSRTMGMPLRIGMFIDHSTPRSLADAILAARGLPAVAAGGPEPVTAAVETHDASLLPEIEELRRVAALVERGGPHEEVKAGIARVLQRMEARRGPSPAAPSPNVCYERRPAATLRLLCVAGAGGRASLFRDMALRFPPDIEVWGLEYPGRGVRASEATARTMQDLVTGLCTEALAALVKAGPFALFGHSIGSNVAFELALALRRELGLEPAHFFAGALYAPSADRARRTRDGSLERMTPDDLYLNLKRELGRGGKHEAFLDEIAADGAAKDAWFSLTHNDIALFEKYEGSRDVLGCPITAVVGSDDELFVSAMDAWRAHTRAAFSSVLLPGGHWSVRSAEQELVATILRALGGTRT